MKCKRYFHWCQHVTVGGKEQVHVSGGDTNCANSDAKKIEVFDVETRKWDFGGYSKFDARKSGPAVANGNGYLVVAEGKLWEFDPDSDGYSKIDDAGVDLDDEYMAAALVEGCLEAD